MKALLRLFVVLNLAAGLVALVLHLDRRYAPHTAQQWQRWLDPPGDDQPVSEDWDQAAEPAPATQQESLAEDVRAASLATPEGRAATPKTATNQPGAKTAVEPVRTPSGTAQTPAVSPMAPPLPPLPQSPPQALPNELRQGAAPLGPSPQGPSATDAGPAAALARRLGGPAKAVTQASSSDDIRTADSFDLMWQSQGGDEEAAARATAELQRRGCTEVHLELARRLFDRDPEVRKELARALPKLRSVDPGPWLLRLARDEDAEVRLTALALMATTGDPALLEPAEGLARQDSDPRIREQAQRIGRQRELTVGRGESRKGALR